MQSLGNLVQCASIEERLDRFDDCRMNFLLHSVRCRGADSTLAMPVEDAALYC